MSNPTLYSLVRSGTPGTVGAFNVNGHSIRVGRVTIFHLFNSALGLLLVHGRSFISSAADHEALDNFVVEARAAGTTIRYVNRLEDFFNPSAMFEKFLKGETVEGITLTVAEYGLPATLKALKARFEDTFKKPEPVYVRSTQPVAPSQKLVVKTSGKTKMRQTVSKTSSSYSLSLPVAEKAVWEIKPLWADNSGAGRVKTLGRSVRAIGDDRSYGRSIEVYGDRIEIGCQTVRREALEELAVAQGWLAA